MPITLNGDTGIQTPMYNGTITANAVTPSVNMKNRVINGEMDISQSAAGATITPVTSTAIATNYPVDRFFIAVSQNSKLTTAQANADGLALAAGFNKCLNVTVTSAYTVGADEVFVLQQRIEGFNVADLVFGTASAKTVTLSFWVKSSLTGTFGGALLGASGTRAYPFTYTISSANTWEQKSVTVAGSTTGTWVTNNGNGLVLAWSLGVGSNLTTTANAWANGEYYNATGAQSIVATNGATWNITGVQLEVGSTATSFDYRPYGTELALCQRYYETIAQNSVGVTLPTTYYSVTNFISQWFFKNTKRASPTLALVNSATFTTTPSNQIATTDSAWLNHTSAFYIQDGTSGLPAYSASAEL